MKNLNIYSMKNSNRERNEKIIIIAILILMIIGIIYIIHNVVNIIQRHEVYKSYEAQLVKLKKEDEEKQKEIEEEQKRIAEEKERKRQEKIPKLTDVGRQNMENIYKSETKRAFLTFDDGPSAVTPTILEILKQQNIKATFFVLGSRVEANPEIVKKIYKDGHYIANHGYSHVYSLIYSSPQAVLDEFNKCNDAVKNAIEVPEYNSHLFRFPGGSPGGPYAQIKTEAKALLEQNDILYVDWNALTGDAEKTDTTSEYQMNRLKQTTENRNSVVILMHDAQAKKVTAETLPQIIAYLKEQGYEFKNFYEIIK